MNRTNYVWIRTGIHSYQMNNWQFPAKINPGESVREYVEWDQNIFHNQNDDAGDVVYALENTSMSFHIEARVINGNFNLKVILSNIPTPLGESIDLGWAHDGTVEFCLTERDGKFFAPIVVSNWMGSNLALLGGRTLKHMCMPGSHDSGMSVRGSDTAFAHDCNVITQTKDILSQLACGVRYFDIRPVISAGQYYTGHYGEISGIGWQGANGQSISSIISQVNAFITVFNELIILNISHDRNTDVGNTSYRPFTPDEWNNLFKLLLGISHLYVAIDPFSDDLTTLTLGAFIGAGKPAVLIIVEPDCELGEFAHKGFYKRSNFNVYNNYADTNDVNQMTKDQMKKLNSKRPNPDAGNFLLSWTLTQSGTQATFCSLGTSDSILELAKLANDASSEIIPHCTPNTYPNIILADNIADTRFLEVSMEINHLAGVTSSPAKGDLPEATGAEPSPV